VLFKDGDLLLPAILEDAKIGGSEVVNGIALLVNHDVDENEVGVGAEERNRMGRVLCCRWRVSRWRRCLSLDCGDVGQNQDSKAGRKERTKMDHSAPPPQQKTYR
jgi:hypothetical protein